MSKSVFLTKGAKVEDLMKSVPKTSVASGFVVNGDVIEYNGNPKAFKFVMPIMVSVVDTLDGFDVVRTPKTYVAKDGSIKTTNVTTFTFKNLADAEILVENVNKICKQRYEEYLANKESK